MWTTLRAVIFGLYIFQLALTILLCFFGFKWMRGILSGYGFLVGFSICYHLLPASIEETLYIALCILAGLIVCGLFFMLHDVSYFFAGAVYGIYLGLCISMLLGQTLSSAPAIGIMLFGGGSVGVLATYSRRKTLTYTSIIIGAFGFGISVHYLLYSWINERAFWVEKLPTLNFGQSFASHVSTNLSIVLILFAVMLVLSYFVQTKITAKNY